MSNRDFSIFISNFNKLSIKNHKSHRETIKQKALTGVNHLTILLKTIL